jgi:hypothetical protein
MRSNLRAALVHPAVVRGEFDHARPPGRPIRAAHPGSRLRERAKRRDVEPDMPCPVSGTCGRREADCCECASYDLLVLIAYDRKAIQVVRFRDDYRVMENDNVHD